MEHTRATKKKDLKDTLTIHYEGYWQCRQATDPDPTEDPRGVSGYTYAVGYESDLDLVIRLQSDEIKKKDFRLRNLPNYPQGLLEAQTGCKSMAEYLKKNKINTPAQLAKVERDLFGIYVTGVDLNGQEYDQGNKALRGGKVRWLPAGEQLKKNGRARGPRYELRNEITYHTRSGIIMPIVPFDMEVTTADGEHYLRRYDPLDKDNPKKEVWELPMEVYSRRSPKNFFNASSEVMEALGFSSTSDPDSQFNSYFQSRKEWLQLRLSMATDAVHISALKNRLFALEFFTENRRIEGKLGLKADWDFDLRGPADVCGLENLVPGKKISDIPWNVKFWMGGFDGDVMRGYMRGTMTVPLV